MKKIILTIAIVLGSMAGFSQPVPPPGSNGQNGNQPGGGAPIDGGFGILLAFSAAYGVKKVYKLIKDTQTNVN